MQIFEIIIRHWFHPWTTCLTLTCYRLDLDIWTRTMEKRWSEEPICTTWALEIFPSMLHVILVSSPSACWLAVTWYSVSLNFTVYDPSLLVFTLMVISGTKQKLSNLVNFLFKFVSAAFSYFLHIFLLSFIPKIPANIQLSRSFLANLSCESEIFWWGCKRESLSNRGRSIIRYELCISWNHPIWSKKITRNFEAARKTEWIQNLFKLKIRFSKMWQNVHKVNSYILFY